MGNNVFQVNCLFGNKKVPMQIEVLGDQLELSFPYFAQLVEEVKCMQRPPNSFNKIKKSWRIYNNRRNLFALDILVNGDKVKVYDKPIVKYSDSLKEDLWAHQKEMYDLFLNRHRAIAAAEMRTGKTRPTFSAIKTIKPEHVYWVAPSKALVGLRSEMQKWGMNMYLNTFTYEAFRNWIQTHTIQNHLNVPIPRFVVFDECQNLKTPTSQVTQAAMFLSDLMEEEYKGEEYMIGLSGTPAPKDPTDWWSVCEVIRSGFIREGSKQLLGKRLGIWEQREGAVGNLYWHLIKWQEEEVYKLYRRLKPMVVVVLKKDCFDLPPIRYEIVELPPSRQMLRVAKTIADNEINVLSATNKLRQLSDGFQYQYEYNEYKNKKERVDTEFVGTPKIGQLKTDLELHEDVGRIIIYAGFTGSVDVVTRTCLEMDWLVLQVDGRGWQIFYPEGYEYVEGFNYTSDNLLAEMDRSRDTHSIGKLAFVGQADSAGIGLELSASPTIIYYSNTNKGASRMQSEARAHSDNMDKTRGLTVIDYIHLPSDLKIRESLMAKKDLQSISMGDLKQVFNNVEVEDGRE